MPINFDNNYLSHEFEINSEVFKNNFTECSPNIIATCKKCKCIVDFKYAEHYKRYYLFYIDMDAKKSYGANTIIEEITCDEMMIKKLLE